MTPYLRVKNWDKFQHYKNKDEHVPWIKLHTRLLSDYEWMQETPSNQIALIKIWLLAASLGNKLPNDAVWLRKRISARTLDLDHLISRGWLEPVYSDSSPRREEVLREEEPGDVDKQRQENLDNLRRMQDHIGKAIA